VKTRTRSGRPLVAAALAALLAGCASALPPQAFEGQGPEMRPERFFAGRTTSFGVLETRAGAPTDWLRVEGAGRTEPDGSFRLDQTVRWGKRHGGPRTWTLRRLDEHRYDGTLTDASGPVRAQAYGRLFHLRYPMKGAPGLSMEQWLYLQEDGRTVLNEATVTLLGVVVARLSERITRE
jgi:hypothetical protein